MKRAAVLAGGFLWTLGGTAVSAEPAEKVRHVVFLEIGYPNAPSFQADVRALRQDLQTHGWVDGRNIRLDVRGMVADAQRTSGEVRQLIAETPDVIIAFASTTVRTLLKQTHAIPIVFLGLSDPVAQGLVTNLARPGGNVTGFTNFDFSIVGKWLQLLKEIAPRTARVLGIAVPEDPPKWLTTLDALAGQFGLEPSRAVIRIPADDAVLAAFARAGRGALVVFPSGDQAAKIVAPAARYRLPAIYPVSSIVQEGGLISYGPNRSDYVRGVAGYVDRILRGAKPGDLPVQNPTTYELAINLGTARALGLTVPQSILLRADQVIR